MKREVDLLQTLKDEECIINLYDCEYRLDKARVSLVLEYGELDLNTFLQYSTPLFRCQSKERYYEVCLLWYQMLKAVQSIHRRNIVHKDLKPQNFLKVKGKLKLIDFGISQRIQGEVTSMIVANPAGTPNYIAPERAMFADDSKINIMISYSHQDSEIMQGIMDLLTTHGFGVWVDTKLKGGANFFKDIGSAVIGCDIFLFLLSEHSISSKYCQDELSLARISNKRILPLTYCSFREITGAMEAGFRLILSCVQWVCLDPKADEVDNNKRFLESLNEVLQSELSEDARLANYTVVADENHEEEMYRSMGTLRRMNSKHFTEFWTRNFGDADSVLVTSILDQIKVDYYWDYLSLNLEDSWALKAMTLWCFNLERNCKTLTRAQYDEFVWPDGRPQEGGPVSADFDRFWIRCKDGFSVRLSMQEVFDSESSVRFDSIRNLSKIKSKRVVIALCKLLRDSDPNIRAVACISLSYTAHQDNADKLVVLLKDPDRLVRESACLALARLKVPATVPALLLTWRNDVISDVRSAAMKALEAIDSSEAKEGIRVVHTLQEEFQKLAASDE
eukprot:sb/3463521/